MTTGAIVFLCFAIGAPLAIFWGAAYGDYKTDGRWFWQTKKDGVNSGSKFG